MSRNTGAGVRPLWGRPAAVIAAAVLVAAGCGSSGGGNGGAAGTTAAAAGTTAAAARTTAAAGTSAPAPGTSAPAAASGTVTDYAAYVGGSGAADASLPPIKVGYISQEGGPVEVGPTNDDGVEIGIKFINEQAGGIGGHPIELTKCYIASTEEEGQQCGQKMANDKDIVAVIEGPVAVGAESMFAALGDKPVVARRVGRTRSTPSRRAPRSCTAARSTSWRRTRTFARDSLKAKSAALDLSRRSRDRHPRRRAGLGLQGGRDPDQGRLLPGQRARPDRAAARRRRTERRRRDAGHQPERLREVREGHPAAQASPTRRCWRARSA